MKKLILTLAVFSFAIISGCKNESKEPVHSHAHGDESNSYTIYSERLELFVEYLPLYVGNNTMFAAHFTRLGDNFTALTKGNLKLSLIVDGDTTSYNSESPVSPGIFRLALKPQKAGQGKLVFEIESEGMTDEIIIDNVNVFADKKTARIDERSNDEGDVSFLKEQAWNIDFATAPVKKQDYLDVIKTSAVILSAPGDEMIISAKSDGLVLFTGNINIVGSEVKKGQSLFTISGGDFATNNIDSQYKNAKFKLEKIKAELVRAKVLLKDKFISQQEFEIHQAEYNLAEVEFNALAKNYSSHGQSVSSDINGYVKDILVKEGQFVNAGDALATITKNKRLLLQANVSQKYFSKLSTIKSANFIFAESETVFSTSDLDGRVLTFGKTANPDSPFIPVTFEINNQGNILAGASATAYLKSSKIENTLVIPMTSLIEEQGHFFVYIQTSGEKFKKQEIVISSMDGVNAQVKSGLKEGERIVTKGAYRIKLSSVSGALPAHGHEH